MSSKYKCGNIFDQAQLLLSFQIALIERNMQMVSECMGLAGDLIEHFSGTPAHKESLKVFFLVLQVCHYLMAGQVCIYLEKAMFLI